MIKSIILAAAALAFCALPASAQDDRREHCGGEYTVEQGTNFGACYGFVRPSDNRYQGAGDSGSAGDGGAAAGDGGSTGAGDGGSTGGDGCK